MKSLLATAILTAFFVTFSQHDAAAGQPIPGVDISAKKNPGGKKPVAMAPNDSNGSDAAGDSAMPLVKQGKKGTTAKSPVAMSPESDSAAQPPMSRMFSSDCERMCKTKCVCDKPGTQSCYCPIPGVPPSRE